ncbi:MAG: type II toxin-antitoxin system Phd/YefM family antitoxin [Phycisphaerales bacterium]|nr:type II toxin-antitoxin system Phd/YefM family antitoxin [Phycisphaerales bacterium]
MVRSTDITSFTEHRQHLREHFDQVNKTGRPLYVTTNGKTEAVVLSPEAYDRLVENAEREAIEREVRAGLEDVKAGRERDFREGIRQIASELGLKLDR